MFNFLCCGLCFWWCICFWWFIKSKVMAFSLLFLIFRSLIKLDFLFGSVIHPEMLFVSDVMFTFWHMYIQWFQHCLLKTFIFLITCYSYTALDRVFTWTCLFHLQNHPVSKGGWSLPSPPPVTDRETKAESVCLLRMVQTVKRRVGPGCGLTDPQSRPPLGEGENRPV